MKDFYDPHAKLYENRVITLFRYINDEVAADLSASLLLLDQDPSKPIDLYLSTRYAELSSVFMIYDIIRNLKSELRILVIGEIDGESLLLLSAVPKSNRFITKNSFLHFNFNIPENGGAVNLHAAKILLEKLKIDQNRWITELSNNLGITQSQIHKWCEDKQMFSAYESIRLNLCGHLK